MFSVMCLMYFKLKSTSLLVKYWSYCCYYGWLGYYRDQHPSLFSIFQQNLEVISCCKLRCLSHDVENSINQKDPGPHVPGFPSAGWHFPTVPSNKTMPGLAVTNWHFHSTIHTRPHRNFSPLQWTLLGTKTLAYSSTEKGRAGDSPRPLCG